MSLSYMQPGHVQLQGGLESVRGRLEAVQQERDSLVSQACSPPWL